MSYCSPDDMRTWLESVARDLSNEVGDEDLAEEKLEAECAAADGEINGYLFPRYGVPVTDETARAILFPHARNIVASSLLRGRIIADSGLQKGIDRTYDWLRGIQTKVGGLAGAAPPVIQDATSDAAYFQSNAPIGERAW